MNMRNIKRVIAGLLAINTAVEAASLLGPGQAAGHIEINNCILAKVNGKAITILDVVKKMDLFFYRQYPQYFEVPQARYEFYQMSWKYFLKEMIDKELIIADAEEMKMAVTPGEIRQEMETLFGANIATRLSDLNMSYEDAAEIIRGDMLIKRMVYFKSQMKAEKSITPQAIRQEYERYAVKNKKPEQWRYRVVSFRSANSERAAKAAAQAYQLLAEKNSALEALQENMKEYGDIAMAVSEEFTLPRGEVSSDYLAVLEGLTNNSYSQPQAQKSRSAKAPVYRIFYLIDHSEEGVPALADVEGVLRKEMLEKAAEEETKRYLEHLRKHFAIQSFYSEESLAKGEFQPFVLY